MKIPQDKRIRTYELTYLVPAGLTAEELKVIVDQVDKLIKKHKVKVIKSDEWGKKPLAYTIQIAGKRYTEADYRHLKLEMETTQVQAFNKDIQLDPQVLRHLLVIEEDVDFKLMADENTVLEDLSAAPTVKAKAVEVAALSEKEEK